MPIRFNVCKNKNTIAIEFICLLQQYFESLDYFQAVQLAHVLCTPDRLVKELMASYLADAIVRTPMLIGSLDLLGSPTLLFGNLTC